MGFQAGQTLRCPSPSPKARLVVAKSSNDIQPCTTLLMTTRPLVYGEGLSGLQTVHAVRRSRASRYLSAVRSATSAGKRGAGGVLSQTWVSNQSRTNCLS